MNKRNFIVVILVFFSKIFTVKCDNKCFVEFKFADYSIKHKDFDNERINIDEKKVNISDITNKHDALIFFQSLNSTHNEGNWTTDDKNICNENPYFLGVVIHKKTEIKNNIYSYPYPFELQPEDYEIMDFNTLKSNLTNNPNNYKDKCIVFYFNRNGYIENLKKCQKKIEVVGTKTSTWGGSESENKICEITELGNIKTKIEEDLKKKANHEFIKFKALEDEKDEINAKFNENEFDNVNLNLEDNNKCFPKTIKEIKDLGGKLEMELNQDGKYKLHVSFKRNFKITITPPKDFKVISIFEKPFVLYDVNFKDFNLSTIINEIAAKMSKMICDRNNDLEKEGGNIGAYELEHIFDIDRNNDYWYDNIGFDSKELNIKCYDKGNNNIDKKINNNNDLKDTCIFFKKDDIVEINFIIGEFSQLLKSVFIPINIEATDNYVLCDRVPKKLVVPLNIEEISKLKNDPDYDKKMEILIKQEFIKFLRRQGIKSETTGEGNMKIPQELFDLFNYNKTKKIEGIIDCCNVIIKFNDNAVGRYCKNEGSEDPTFFDPDTDEDYINNPTKPIIKTVHKEEYKKEQIQKKEIKKLCCCSGFLSKCCCCCCPSRN